MENNPDPSDDSGNDGYSGCNDGRLSILTKDGTNFAFFARVKAEVSRASVDTNGFGSVSQ